MQVFLPQKNKKITFCAMWLAKMVVSRLRGKNLKTFELGVRGLGVGRVKSVYILCIYTVKAPKCTFWGFILG